MSKPAGSRRARCSTLTAGSHDSGRVHIPVGPRKLAVLTPRVDPCPDWEPRWEAMRLGLALRNRSRGIGRLGLEARTLGSKRSASERVRTHADGSAEFGTRFGTWNRHPLGRLGSCCAVSIGLRSPRRECQRTRRAASVGRRWALARAVVSMSRARSDPTSPAAPARCLGCAPWMALRATGEYIPWLCPATRELMEPPPRTVLPVGASRDIESQITAPAMIPGDDERRGHSRGQLGLAHGARPGWPR